jgi:hypothetical protein
LTVRVCCIVALLPALAGCTAAPAGPGLRDPTIGMGVEQGCDIVRVASVGLEAGRGVWVVPVEIGGTRVRLILDTGAERTLLTEAAVARLGMVRDPHHETRTFAIGGLSTGADALVTSFAVGGAYLPVPSVTVGQFALPERVGPPLDGLLGADVLSAFDVDIDTQAARRHGRGRICRSAPSSGRATGCWCRSRSMASRPSPRWIRGRSTPRSASAWPSVPGRARRRWRTTP